MRKIIVSTFLSMDGVMQGPGGPTEDPTGNFKYGGWMFPLGDDTTDAAMGKVVSQPYDLLLGHFTYDIFAAYWPYQQDNPMAEAFTKAQKFVVANSEVDLSWKNSTLITGNVEEQLKQLKETEGPALLVYGSGDMVRSLLKYNLVDQMHLWTLPVILGRGKKLFGDDVPAKEWQLTDSVVSPSGVFIGTYVPKGEVRSGSFLPDEPSEKELARRERIKGL